MINDQGRRTLLRAFCAGISGMCVPYAVAENSRREDEAAAPSLRSMIADPLLVQSLYRLAVSRDYSFDGAAGTNRDRYHWIEEQRQGVEWIVRGYAQVKADWIELGWREVDWGLARQQSDGGFASKDGFHSTSFFVEALARACLIDPTGANTERVHGLKRAAAWLMRADIEQKGAASNAPFTHRRYILAAALGQAGSVTGDQAAIERAQLWAENGLARQRQDGTNPERDGYDVGYQMVGVLMALRYLPVCQNPGLRAKLRAMVRRATKPELTRMGDDGTIDAGNSTRIGKEHARNGKVKEVPYGEILQALVYAAHALPEPQWIEPATRIARLRGWLKA